MSKILVIQQKMIGDVLTSSILFEALREKYPDAELHHLIQPHTSPVVENNPFIDRLVFFDPQEYKGIKGLFKFAHQVRAQKYDIVIDVYAKLNSAIITAISGAKTRISYKKWYTSSVYTKTFSLNKEPKTRAGVAIENRMLLLQGIEKNFPVECKPKIYLKQEEISFARQRLSESGIGTEKPLIMIAILGSSPEKTYPAGYMAEILDFIVEKAGAQLIFNYNPKQEAEARAIVERCKPGTKRSIHFEVFGNGLREFLALTSHCDALIGNEGGAVNMAKAIDIPTFSIFSPQIEKKVWAVYQDELNVAVHIDDYLDQKNNSTGERTYENFIPSLLQPHLDEFLKRLNLKYFR